MGVVVVTIATIVVMVVVNRDGRVSDRRSQNRASWQPPPEY